MADNFRGRGGRGGRGGYQGGQGGGRGGYQGGQGGGRGAYQGGQGGGRGAYQGGQGRGRGAYQGGQGGGYQGGVQRGGHPGGRGGFSRGAGHGGRGGGTGGPPPPIPESAVQKIQRNQLMSAGTLGSEVALLANLYRLTTSDLTFYQYDVSIEFEKREDLETKFSQMELAKKNERNQLFIRKHSATILEEAMKQNPDYFGRSPTYLFDGSRIMYVIKEFPGSLDKSVKAMIEGRTKTFTVAIKRTSNVGVDTAAVKQYYQTDKKSDKITPEVMTVYELFLNHFIGQGFSSNKRSFFDADKTVGSSFAVPYIDFVPGFTGALRRTEFGLALNVHLRTGCIISRRFKTLPELIAQILNKNSVNESDWKNQRIYSTINNSPAIKRLKIVTHNPKTNKKIGYQVKEVLFKFPEEHVFELKGQNGKPDEQTNVFDYVAKQYGVKVNKNMPIVAMTKKEVVIPIELCRLVGDQYVDASRNDRLQDELLRNSTHNPSVYFNKTGQIVGQVAGLLRRGEDIYNVGLEPKPVAFSGRVLPAPQMTGPNKFVKPASGQFIIFSLYGDVSDQPGPSSLGNIQNQLLEQAKFLGMKLTCVHKELLRLDRIARNSIENLYKNVKRFTPANIVFIVLPPGSNELYRWIKARGNCVEGIVTQCLNGPKVIQKGERSYFVNVLRKVNSKLDGVNGQVTPPINWGNANPQVKKEVQDVFNLRETLVMGIDVVHPGATSNVRSSIAAAVGSLNADATKFGTSLRVQQKVDGTQEIVDQIGDMTAELLAQYRRANNGNNPKKLIVFRDGVSEGQFEQVEDIEVKKIRAACKKEIPQGIKMLVLIVQKRHKVRFVCQQGWDPTGKGRLTNNVKQGTVVDKCIVDPQYQDFYLNSHFSPLGTSKPSRYIVVTNELNYKANQIEMLCYYLCHNCGRTDKVISIPTPVRYADLLAYMSLVHFGIHSGSRPQGCAGDDLTQEQERRIIDNLNEKLKINEKLKARLFYL